MGSINPPPPHIIIFPFMAQGHTLPLLDFAKVLSRRGVKVTIITTPANVKQVSLVVTDFSSISTHVIPFPVVDDLDAGCENTKDLASEDQHVSFLRAVVKLKEPFECYLNKVLEKEGHPICVICDFFLGWAIPICSSLNIPGILFHGLGVLSTAISYMVHTNVECRISLCNDRKLKTLPNLECPFTLVVDDFPGLEHENDSNIKFLEETGISDAGSKYCWGILFNSFEELEGGFVRAIEDAFGRNIKAWCVGPLLLYDQERSETCLKDGSKSKSSSVKCVDHTSKPCDSYQSWLDDQQESVIYISFGTQSFVSNVQLDELAFGLEIAGHRFIWVVRSSNWTPPEGWLQRVKGKGLVIREWVDQRSVLGHPAVSGFLSHCGWNSVLESLSMGVPLLTWPMGAEQPLNEKLLVHVLKVGLAIDPNLDEVKIENARFGCKAISSGVKELMGGESGKLARQRAKEIGEMARKAVEPNGSSSKKVDQLIQTLKEWKIKVKSSN